MYEKGFSLLELMITVAIVGILASLGARSFVDSISRSQMTDVVSGLGMVKNEVFLNLTGGTCRDPVAANNIFETKYGVVLVEGFPPENNGSSVEQYGTGCRLTYEFNSEDVSSKLARKKYLVYVRDNGTYIFNWTNIDKKYIPVSLR